MSSLKILTSKDEDCALKNALKLAAQPLASREANLIEHRETLTRLYRDSRAPLGIVREMEGEIPRGVTLWSLRPRECLNGCECHSANGYRLGGSLYTNKGLDLKGCRVHSIGRFTNILKDTLQKAFNIFNKKARNEKS